MPDKVRNVFMSHIHEDDGALPQLKATVTSGDLSIQSR